MTSEQPLTVSQLTYAIKKRLEASFPRITVQGEVSNFRRQSSGHLYFSLKDSNSQVSCVMWKGPASKLQVLPKDGDHLILHGEVNVYPPRGNYQLIVHQLSHVGVGELLLKLEQLKREIHARGWFSKEHKKPLPKFPRTIGVVTSPTGAAFQDILNVLSRRRQGGFHVILNPVKVQGEGSAAEIAQAIKQFNDHPIVDVMIVGRGGGSIEDLWAFNEEIVASAIFHSKIPIIGAVGHEIDHCIAEHVADVRAPTPSAAAELVIAESAQQEQQLEQFHHQLRRSVHHLIDKNRHRLQGLLKQPLFSSTYALLGPWMQKLDDLRESIDLRIKQLLEHHQFRLSAIEKQTAALQPTVRLQNLKQKLQRIDQALNTAAQNKLYSCRCLFDVQAINKQLDQLVQQIIYLRRENLKKLTTNLRSIDPKSLLRRGYSIVFAEKDGSVINSIQKLSEGEHLKLLVSDGEIKATINKIFFKDSHE